MPLLPGCDKGNESRSVKLWPLCPAPVSVHRAGPAAGEVGGVPDAGGAERNGLISILRKPVIYRGKQTPWNKCNALLATIEMGVGGGILQKNCQLASLGVWGLAA